nr:glycosyltransferase [Clostridium polynesiense]
MDESKPLILGIGIRAIKNTETIIESFINNEALYNSAQLLLIGDKEESYARDIVNKYKDYENVKFMDYVEPKYLNAIYKKSSLYVQISLFETFGVSIIEALLHKKQVVISSKLPIADYFTQEEVIFYNPEEDNLDLLMLKGLENSKEANTLGFKKAGDLFNWDRVSDKYYAFFKKICEEKK